MNFKNNHIVILLISFLFISSCSSTKTNIAKNYGNSKSAKFDIRKYFDGNLEGWGLIQDEKGIVTKRFIMKIKGSWEDNRGVIKRQFYFDDGKKDSITWLVTVNDDNNYMVIGHDIVGNAHGEQYGSASKIKYNMSMMLGETKQKINIEDIIYTINDQSLMSISSLKKSKVFNKGKMIIALTKKTNKINKIRTKLEHKHREEPEEKEPEESPKEVESDKKTTKKSYLYKEEGRAGKF